MSKQELEQKDLLIKASMELVKKQNAKLDFIEKRLKRQDRIINEYLKINKELEDEIQDYREISKLISKEYQKNLKELS
jgi:hypothetical protein